MPNNKYSITRVHQRVLASWKNDQNNELMELENVLVA